MAEKKVWATSDDGSIEYVSITEDLVEPTLKMMQKSFYSIENVCTAYGLPNRPDVFGEMDGLGRHAIKDNISIAAVDKATGKVVGAALNRLQTREGISSPFFEEYAKCLKSTSPVIGIINWMSEIETYFNVFEEVDHGQVDCVMEIMFAGVDPNYTQRGIATKLFETSINLAKNLKYNNTSSETSNARQSINRTDKKGLQISPKLVTGIFSSFITQRIAKNLNFVIGVQVDYDQFIIDKNTDKTMMDVIGHHTPYVTYEYLKL